MTTLTLHAQPYDTSATGFYFTSVEDYDAKYAAREPVEEYEIQFIDGSEDEATLSKLVDLCQVSIARFFELVEDDISGDELIALEYLVDNRGYDLNDALEKRTEVELYKGSLTDYAEEFIADCYNLPEIAIRYFDYDKFANDLDCGGDCDQIEHDLWVTNVNSL